MSIRSRPVPELARLILVDLVCQHNKITLDYETQLLTLIEQQSLGCPDSCRFERTHVLAQLSQHAITPPANAARNLINQSSLDIVHRRNTPIHSYWLGESRADPFGGQCNTDKRLRGLEYSNQVNQGVCPSVRLVLSLCVKKWHKESGKIVPWNIIVGLYLASW